jgi:hypothetical protein
MKRDNNISKIFGDEMNREKNNVKCNVECNIECNVECNVESETSKKTKIMKDIEIKTEEKIIHSFQSGQLTNPLSEKSPVKQEKNQDVLLSLLSEGSKEFQEQMGRQMTYGEMRAMWG